MVADFRCGELKKEAIEKIEGMIGKLKEDSERKILNNFEEQCSIILKSSITHYDEFAHQYDQPTYHKIRKELAGIVISLLFIPFDSQLKMLRQKTFEEFDFQIRKYSIKDQVNEQFNSKAGKLYDTMLGEFKKKSAALIIDGSGWGE